MCFPFIRFISLQKELVWYYEWIESQSHIYGILKCLHYIVVTLSCIYFMDWCLMYYGIWMFILHKWSYVVWADRWCEGILLDRRNMLCQKHVTRNDNLRLFFLMYLILVTRGTVTVKPFQGNHKSDLQGPNTASSVRRWKNHDTNFSMTKM